jgi:hypothetical protein
MPAKNTPGTVLGLRLIHGPKTKRTLLIHLWDDLNAQAAAPECSTMLATILKTLGASPIWYHNAQEDLRKLNTLLAYHDKKPLDMALHDINAMISPMTLATLATQLKHPHCEIEAMDTSSIRCLNVLETCWHQFLKIQLDTKPLMDDDPICTLEDLLTKKELTHLSLLQKQSHLDSDLDITLALLHAQGIPIPVLARVERTRDPDGI